MNMSLNITTADLATISYACTDSAVGRILLAHNHIGICAVILGEDDASLFAELTKLFPKQLFVPSDSSLNEAMTQLLNVIEQPEAVLTYPIDRQGTLFQQSVWQALQTIPVGQTLTYKQLAEHLGKPKAVRAVANACAANKLAIIIPCHRIIGSNGTLTGYRWGTERKQRLLDIERQHLHSNSTS